MSRHRARRCSDANGQRFIAVSGEALSLIEIAKILKARLGDAARKVPTRRLPSWFVRLTAKFNRRMRPLIPLLGVVRNPTSAKADRVLGWKPRSPEDAIVATAESLLKFGLVDGSSRVAA
jgi:dihydroflavonol-4-reductase